MRSPSPSASQSSSTQDDHPRHRLFILLLHRIAAPPHRTDSHPDSRHAEGRGKHRPGPRTLRPPLAWPDDAWLPLIEPLADGIRRRHLRLRHRRACPCGTSPYRLRRARRWLCSAAPAAARRPSRGSSRRLFDPTEGGIRLGGVPLRATRPWPMCAAGSVWSPRMCNSSAARCAIT